MYEARVQEGTAMKSFDAAAAYRLYIADFCNGEFALANALVSADCRIHVAGVPDSAYRGADGLRALVHAARAPFASLTFRIAVGPIVQGDLLAARWNADGIYAGGLPG